MKFKVLLKPAFVTDKTFGVMNHFRMSTSTLNSPHVSAGGFGPVVEDGYALGYMVYDDFIGVVAISKEKLALLLQNKLFNNVLLFFTDGNIIKNAIILKLYL